jgi:hypothetical protein
MVRGLLGWAPAIEQPGDGRGDATGPGRHQLRRAHPSSPTGSACPDTPAAAAGITHHRGTGRVRAAAVSPAPPGAAGSRPARAGAMTPAAELRTSSSQLTPLSPSPSRSQLWRRPAPAAGPAVPDLAPPARPARPRSSTPRRPPPRRVRARASWPASLVLRPSPQSLRTARRRRPTPRSGRRAPPARAGHDRAGPGRAGDVRAARADRSRKPAARPPRPPRPAYPVCPGRLSRSARKGELGGAAGPVGWGPSPSPSGSEPSRLSDPRGLIRFMVGALEPAGPRGRWSK